MVRSLRCFPDGEIAHAIYRGLEDCLVPDLKAILVEASLGWIARALLKDVRCLLIKFMLRNLVGRWWRGRRGIKRGKVAHVTRSTSAGPNYGGIGTVP